MATNNEQEIRKWMQEVAESKKPRKKLIFDKKTKRLIAISATDSRADKSLEFTPQEATRFSTK